MTSTTRPQSLFTLFPLLGALACGASGDASAARAPGAEAGDPAPVAAVSGVEAADSQSPSASPVRVGIDVLLSDSIHVVRGRRVGVVTNHTGISHDSDGGLIHTIDRLVAHPEIDLVAIFGPEHGYRGEAEAGEHVASGRDPVTGLPVHSLYGSSDRRKPTPDMMKGIDLMLFDIQDIGARYYTYVSTMALAMEAAGEAGIPFVVLDRPNPIGGVAVQGTVLDPEFATFVGMFPVPMRHGLTPGELARLMAGEFGVEASLIVIPVDGWRRGMSFDETGLPWVAPSPNMPDIVSALHYPGTCLFEGTSLSVGRGTDRPFQQVGAPWIDGEALASSLNAVGLPGVRFEATTFTPERPGDRKFPETAVQGVRFVALDESYDPTRTAVAALEAARFQSGEHWEWRVSHFDRLAGTDELRRSLDAGWTWERAVASWTEPLQAFIALRTPYLIYP